MKKLILTVGLLVALSGLIRTVDAQATTSIVGYGSDLSGRVHLINLETATWMSSFDVGVPLQGLAIDPTGTTLYGTDQNGILYSVDITTKTITTIGSTGLGGGLGIEALDFNFNATELWATNADPSAPAIYSINIDPTDTIIDATAALIQTPDPTFGGTVRAMTADTTDSVWIANDLTPFEAMGFQSFNTAIISGNVTRIGFLDGDTVPFPFPVANPNITGMDRAANGVLYGLSNVEIPGAPGGGGVYIINQEPSVINGGTLDETITPRLSLVGTIVDPQTGAAIQWLGLAISTADSAGGSSNDTGKIGDTVFCDLNDDGMQDSGEPGITGVTVNLTCAGPDGLFSTGDDITGTQVTVADGKYLFTVVLPGECVVEVVLATVPDDKEPASCSLTTVPPITLLPGEINLNVDFCLKTKPGEIGDTVFCDLNDNGIQDLLNELGITGVTVNLTCAGPDWIFGTADDITAEQTTDTSGGYLFEGVPAGSCKVEVDVTTIPYDKEQGLCSLITPPITLIPGQSYLDADFCLRTKPGVIGDLVWCDTNDDGVADSGEPGIEGVVVNITCAGPDGLIGTADDITDMQITDADGEYLFVDVPAGRCDVTVDPAAVPGKEPGSNFPPLNLNTVDLQPDQSYLDADFGFKTILSEVGDFVWCDLNDDGVQDLGEPGISGVMVALTCAGPDGLIGTADDITDTQITTAYGLYLFTGVPSGSCKVTVDVTTVPADKEPGSCPTTVNVDLAAGESFLNADFCFKLLCGDCDGKVTKLTLQYNGVDGKYVTVKQKKPEQVVFDSGAPLASGDQFDVEIVKDVDGNLKNTEISIFVDGCLNTNIHTSCSRPIGPGIVSGSFEIIGGESRNGGILCSPQNGVGGKDCCEGKVTSLALRNGGAAGSIMVTQKNGGQVFAENVDHLGAFSFMGTDNLTLGTEITITDGNGVETKIHTSCSKLIGIGSVFGNFTVLEGSSLKGGPLCPVDEIVDDGSDDDSSSDDDCCEGKVTSLKLENGGAGGFIMVKQKNGDVVFEQNVNHLSAFSFIGTDNLTLGTEITITDANGVETMIHTSCSKPIGIGSVFGNFTVLEGSSLKGGPLCPVDELGDDGGDDDSGSRHHKYKKSHWKDPKRSHKNCDKKSHKKHHKKRCKKK